MMPAELLLISCAIIVMVSAAVFDVRDREIPDIHWMVLCLLAGVLAFIRFDAGIAFLISVGIFLMAAFMFSERLEGMSSVFVLALSATAFVIGYVRSEDITILVILAMSMFILVMYWAGLLKGGADAKALISLSLLLPVYPDGLGLLWGPSYPLGYVFNPVFSILLLSLVFSLTVVFYIWSKNSQAGSRGLSSFPMRIETARGSFVWPVEDVIEGELVKLKGFENKDEVYDRLESNGFDTVRVTPMIPFLLPMAAATLIVVLLGSPLFMF